MVVESFEGYILDVLIKKVHYENLINRVKSFEDACFLLNIKPAVPDVSTLLKELRPSLIAQYKLIIITKALNEGWKPDWTDVNQYKYYNSFYMNNGTFSFYYTYFDNNCVSVPSALFFKNLELAVYAKQMFIGLYKDYLTN
jgi:hypothetical protein